MDGESQTTCRSYKLTNMAAVGLLPRCFATRWFSALCTQHVHITPGTSEPLPLLRLGPGIRNLKVMSKTAPSKRFPPSQVPLRTRSSSSNPQTVFLGYFFKSRIADEHVLMSASAFCEINKRKRRFFCDWVLPSPRGTTQKQALVGWLSNVIGQNFKWAVLNYLIDDAACESMKPEMVMPVSRVKRRSRRQWKTPS